jgi:hypothetical protein
MASRHFTPARDREQAGLGIRVEAANEAGEVACGADKACRGRERIRWIVTWDGEAPPHRQTGAMPNRHWCVEGGRYVRRGGVEPCRRYDLARNPGPVILARYSLDHETSESEADI